MRLNQFLAMVLATTASIGVRAAGGNPVGGDVGNVRVTPKAEGEELCFKREYDANHLTAHKKQVLTTVYVSVVGRTVTMEDGADNYYSVETEMMALDRKGKLWGNKAYCRDPKPTSMRCGVPCDGGAFEMIGENEKTALLQVAKDYYYPLMKEGVDIENVDPELWDSIRMSLNYEDVENRVYRLAPVPAAECAKFRKKFKAVPEMGCR